MARSPRRRPGGEGEHEEERGRAARGGEGERQPTAGGRERVEGGGGVPGGGRGSRAVGGGGRRRFHSGGEGRPGGHPSLVSTKTERWGARVWGSAVTNHSVPPPPLPLSSPCSPKGLSPCQGELSVMLSEHPPTHPTTHTHTHTHTRPGAGDTFKRLRRGRGEDGEGRLSDHTAWGAQEGPWHGFGVAGG